MQKSTGLKDRGVKSSGFGVLRPQHHAPSTAACPVEVSFMDVATEEARLRTEAYKDKPAFALASAIKGWFVADGRMPAHALLGPLRTGRIEGGTESEDGFEELLLKEARTGGRVSQP